jgi:Cysteine synthase
VRLHAAALLEYVCMKVSHGCANTEQQRTAAVETEAKVPIISTPQGFNEEELYVDLEPTFGRSLFLKCEGFNFAGSIKLKAASEMMRRPNGTES